jgi:hypothetical protein
MEPTGWTAGELRVPRLAEVVAPAPRPAVVNARGSSGVDSRGEAYSRALNEIEIATFELDLWAPRKVMSLADRPKRGCGDAA